jgi:hypothetical protein
LAECEQLTCLHVATGNYGSPFSAFIDQYFGTFREKLGDSKVYRGASNGTNVDDDAAAAKKKQDDPKVSSSVKREWSATGYLGWPQNWAHGVYTLFWGSLFPLVWWGAVANHSTPEAAGGGGGGGLVRESIGKISTPTAVATVVAYSPVAMAMFLCLASGDKMSWRWPFQKERVLGTFGLFLVLGWAACIVPVYHATHYICSA